MPCAGNGSRALRAGDSGPKQYQMLLGQPLVMHTLAAFAQADLAGVLLVVSPDDDFWSEQELAFATLSVASCGGATRAQSVLNGLSHLLANGAHTNDWVLVHDAARCLVTPEAVSALIDACCNDPVGGLLALPLPDTLKVARDARVAQTLDRSDKWLAQTPQMFRAGALHAALQAQAADHFEGITDEASAMEMAGFAPKLVVGSPHNFKVTYPPDFALAEDLLGSRK